MRFPRPLNPTPLNPRRRRPNKVIRAAREKLMWKWPVPVARIAHPATVSLLYLLACILVGCNCPASEVPTKAPRTKAASHALRQQRLAKQPAMAMHGLASAAIVVLPPRVVTLVWSNPPNQLTVYNALWRSDALPSFTRLWAGVGTNLVDAPGSNTFYSVSASYANPNPAP